MAQAAAKVTTTRPLVEISPIPDTVCCELAMVERIGPLTRLTFATPQADGANSYTHRVAVAKLVIPTEMLPAVICAMGQVAHLNMTAGGEVLDDDSASTRH